LLVKLLVFSNH